MEPTIAVIIPIRGRVARLAQCLASIRVGSVQPAEIVVVDDGNDADDREHIERLSREHGARVISVSPARGAPHARNVGAAATSAPLLFFCDADIELAPYALEILSDALREHPEAAFAYGDFAFGSTRMRGQAFSAAALRRHNYISTMSLLRRSAFPGFDESLWRFQDWDLWLTIAARGGSGVYVARELFRASPDGVMSKWIPGFIVRHAAWFPWIPRVKAYAAARAIIAAKHQLED